jgi:sulfatase maturation enzyme AslB (radical SAM superfamily)
MLKLKRTIKRIAKKSLGYINKQIDPMEHRVASSLVNFVTRPGFRATVMNYFLNRREIQMKVERHVPLPRNLYFEGTNICNADCVFCPYTRMERPKKTMSMDFFRNVVGQYVEMGGRAVGFTPIVGDPMVDKFLLDRLEYLDSLKQITKVGFYTNGIALTPEKVDRLVEFKNTTINLNISFGGHDRATFQKMMGVDRFHLVQKNVLYLLDVLENKGHDRFIVKIDFRCPDPDNPDPFGRRVHECISSGLLRMDSLEGSYDTFGGYMTQADLDRADLGLSMDYGYPKFGPCEIPFTKPIVLADGRLNACAERDLEAVLTIGDLTRESLKDVLYGPRMQEFVRQFYEPHLLPEVCQKCTVYQSVYNPKAKVWKEDLNWGAVREL